MKPTREFLFKHPAHFIALGFGSGMAPKAPGTFGTLAALPIYSVTMWVGGVGGVGGVGATWLGGAGINGTGLLATIAVLLFFIGIWASGVTGAALGVSDHSDIVIDEIAAFLLILVFTPPSWPWIVLAFVLFRVFDILKPWPISVADRRIKGGFGVMFDDLLADIFTIICLWFLRSIFVGVTL